MAGREYHEIRKRLSDDPASTSQHIGYARTLLGSLKEHMAFNKLKQLSWTKDFSDGVRITVSSIFGQDAVDIQVPNHPLTIGKPAKHGKWVEKFIKVKSLTGVLGVFRKPYPETQLYVFLWRPGKGSIDIGTGPSCVSGGLSQDASVAAYTENYGYDYSKVVRWTESGVEYMSQNGKAANISDNARFITGKLISGNVFLWDHDDGSIVSMDMGGHLGATDDICADDVSNEGFVAGHLTVSQLGYRPALWAKDGSRTDLSYTGYLAGQALAVSDDGSVVVGYVTYYDGSQNKAPAAMWRKKNGYALEVLPSVPGYDTEGVMLFVPSTVDVSADGSIVFISFVRVMDGARLVAKWTESVGLTVLPIPDAGPTAWGTTRFGDAVTGSVFISGGDENAFVWHDGNYLVLPLPSGGDMSAGNCVASMEREISDGFRYEEATNLNQE